jgi:hypothetical protein
VSEGVTAAARKRSVELLRVLEVACGLEDSGGYQLCLPRAQA